jgi:hypothetical protein
MSVENHMGLLGSKCGLFKMKEILNQVQTLLQFSSDRPQEDVFFCRHKLQRMSKQYQWQRSY